MRRRTNKQANQSLSGPAQPPDGPNIVLLDKFRKFAYWGILVVFLIFAGLAHFWSRWALPTTLAEVTPYAARVALFIVMVSLALRWVISTNHEFKLWMRWLENPPQTNDVYWAIIGLSIILGSCLALAYDVLWIALILTLYFLLNYWTQWLSNDHFVRALPGTREKLQSEPQRAALQVLEVLEHYWLKRPQLARITTMMFVSSVAFSAALAGYVQKEPQKHQFQLFAASVLIVTILGGELWIAFWRRKRDQDITKVIEGKLPARVAPIKEDPATKADKEDLKNFSLYAYALIFCFTFGWAAVAFGIATLNNNVKLSGVLFPFTWDFQSLLFLASLLFCIELFGLCIFWIVETRNELRIWIKWLRNPIDKLQVSFAIIGLAFALGTALAFFYSIVFISAFMTIYLLVNYWTQWLSNDHFDRALERTKRALERAKEDPLMHTKREVLSVMKVYWVDRPQLARVATLMFFASMGFSFALAGYFQEEPMRHRFYLASYGVLFLDILIGEIVIFRWRRRRDRDIDEARQSKELIHNV